MDNRHTGFTTDGVQSVLRVYPFQNLYEYFVEHEKYLFFLRNIVEKVRLDVVRIFAITEVAYFLQIYYYTRPGKTAARTRACAYEVSTT